MDQQKLSSLLQRIPELSERTPFCPENELIAQYLDACLSDRLHTRVQNHVADCAYCQAQLGVMARQSQDDPLVEDDAEMAAIAKQIATGSASQKVRRTPVWATAAVVLIALFAIINRNQDPVLETGVNPSLNPPVTENSSQLRSVNRLTHSLKVLYPAPGTDIGPGSLIRWGDVPGNLHYNIYVLSMAGDVLWSEHLAGNEWVLDESLQLAAGSQYYFRVEAQFADGSSMSSKHVVFRVTQGQ